MDPLRDYTVNELDSLVKSWGYLYTVQIELWWYKLRDYYGRNNQKNNCTKVENNISHLITRKYLMFPRSSITQGQQREHTRRR